MLPAFVLILLFIILLFPQFWVQKVIKKYSEPIKTLPGTGGELAQHLVKRFKLDGVSIKKVENGNDHYNPETKTIALSESNYNEKSDILGYLPGDRKLINDKGIKKKTREGSGGEGEEKEFNWIE